MLTIILLVIIALISLAVLINVVGIKHRIDYYLKTEDKNYDKDKYGLE